MRFLSPDGAVGLEGLSFIPGLVPGIQPTECFGASGTMDPGDKHRDDTLSECHANETRMRRFCLPFFSIRVTTTGPISAVLLTCVPPQGCGSTEPPSPMTTRRT